MSEPRVIQSSTGRSSAWALVALFAFLLAGVGVALAPRASALPPERPAPAVEVASLFHVPAAAGADVITGSTTVPGLSSLGLRPTERYPAIAYAITISLITTDSVVNWTTTDGSVVLPDDLNNGTALVAGRLYTFTRGASRWAKNGDKDLHYNLRCETATTLGVLHVTEVRSDHR